MHLNRKSYSSEFLLQKHLSQRSIEEGLFKVAINKRIKTYLNDKGTYNEVPSIIYMILYVVVIPHKSSKALNLNSYHGEI